MQPSVHLATGPTLLADIPPYQQQAGRQSVWTESPLGESFGETKAHYVHSGPPEDRRCPKGEMGNMKGEAEESSLEPISSHTEQKARPGRKGEVGFAVDNRLTISPIKENSESSQTGIHA